MTRIFQAMTLNEGASITLDADASHHVARVLRAEVGDPLIIFNGLGGEYNSIISEITKKSVQVSLKEFNPREAESPIALWLIQGISRGEKMDYTIQKAVELGVTKIIPVFTERCNVKLDKERLDKRLEHWRAIIISATEQSGRNRIPEIVMPTALENILPSLTADWRFALSPHTTQKLQQTRIAEHQSIALLIGPEGGLSEKEVHFAEQHQFLPLNLGPRIMRTETAAVAAIAVLQSWFGDMR